MTRTRQIDALLHDIEAACIRSHCSLPAVISALAFSTSCALAQLSEQQAQAVAVRVATQLLTATGIELPECLPTRH